ncbi:MAG TPA: hypothetical protein VNU46_00625 [Gemmatimonadaceae bacterium]|jgi:hypothetical protein|nr:hypothetical protein [Gemmatimonadaceae bacterium]
MIVAIPPNAVKGLKLALALLGPVVAVLFLHWRILGLRTPFSSLPR